MIIETSVTIIDKKQNITINVIFETSVTAMDNKYNNWTKPYNYKPSIYRTYGSPHSKWIRYPLHQRGCPVNICVLFLDIYNYLN